MTRNGLPVNTFRDRDVDPSQNVFPIGDDVLIPRVGIGPRITLHHALYDVLRHRGVYNPGNITVGIERNYDLQIQWSKRPRTHVTPGIDGELLESLESPVKNMSDELNADLKAFVVAYQDVLERARAAHNCEPHPTHVVIDSDRRRIKRIQGKRRTRIPPNCNVPFVQLHDDGDRVIRHTDGMLVQKIDGALEMESDHTWVIDREDCPAFPFLRLRNSPCLKGKIYQASENETVFFVGDKGMHSLSAPRPGKVVRQLVSVDLEFAR